MIDIREFGGTGDGATLNDYSFANVIATLPPGGGAISLGPGIYRISKPITVRSAIKLIGDGAYNTVIQQAAPGQSGISGVDIHDFDLVDIGITGAGPATTAAPGISLTRQAAANTAYIGLRGVAVQSFSGDGIAISNPIVSRLDMVRALTNGGHGINLHGVPGGAAGTSCHLSACYAVANAGSGYVLNKMAYSKLDACASDKNAVGYTLRASDGIVMAACGAEAILPAGNGYSGNGVLIDASSGVDVEGFFSYEASGPVISLVNGSSGVRIGVVTNIAPLVPVQLVVTDATSHVE